MTPDNRPLRLAVPPFDAKMSSFSLLPPRGTREGEIFPSSTHPVNLHRPAAPLLSLSLLLARPSVQKDVVFFLFLPSLPTHPSRHKSDRVSQTTTHILDGTNERPTHPTPIEVVYAKFGHANKFRGAKAGTLSTTTRAFSQTSGNNVFSDFFLRGNATWLDKNERRV